MARPWPCLVDRKGDGDLRIRGYAPATPCWAELMIPDPAAAIAFYSGLFGWEAHPTEVGSTVFTLGGAAAAGVVAAPAADQPAGWLTYISTEDINATVTAVSDAGGAVLRPPTAVGDRGQMAVCADPEGAVFAVWQRGTFRGAQVASEPNAVCWSDLATRDMAAAVTFYGKVFGWADQPGSLAGELEYFEWAVQNRVVAGMFALGEEVPAGVPAHWRTTFEVDDCGEIARRCVELGGQVALAPMGVGAGTYAQLLDPAGAAFGVIELIPQLRVTR